MRELLDKGIVPVQHEMAEGRLKKEFFGGPPATKEGFWNDVRDKYRDTWDPEVGSHSTSVCWQCEVLAAWAHTFIVATAAVFTG